MALSSVHVLCMDSGSVCSHVPCMRVACISVLRQGHMQVYHLVPFSRAGEPVILHQQTLLTGQAAPQQCTSSAQAEFVRSCVEFVRKCALASLQHAQGLKKVGVYLSMRTFVHKHISIHRLAGEDGDLLRSCVGRGLALVHTSH